MTKSLLAITTALLFAISQATAHEGVETGPNGGRILDFSKNESLHGEMTVVDGKFHIALLDKEMKPVELGDKVLTATGGDRNAPDKLAVEKKDAHFIVPAVKDGQWVIFQYRESAKAKPITARVHYDTSNCGECNKPEWLCACGADDDKKKKK